MTRKLSGTGGLTLTELLISSVLMGIVMVGIAAFSATIKRMYDTNDKQTILAMQAAAVVGHIERNFLVARGHQDTDATCLACGTALNNNGDCNCRETNCPETAFHMCTANPESYWSVRTDPNNTPDDYTDDQWAIVIRPNNGVDQYSLFTCTQPEGSGPGLGPAPGNTSCANANRILLVNDRVQAMTMTRTADPNPAILDFFIDVSVTVSQDPTSTGDDPLDDPAFTITTRIPMPGHSWN